MVISTEELQSLVFCLGTGLSSLEADALRLYLEGSSYEDMAERLGVRHEDDRQRPPAREAQDHHAPEGPRSPPLKDLNGDTPRKETVIFSRRWPSIAANFPCHERAGVAQLVEHRICNRRPWVRVPPPALRLKTVSVSLWRSTGSRRSGIPGSARRSFRPCRSTPRYRGRPRRRTGDPPQRRAQPARAARRPRARRGERRARGRGPPGEDVSRSARPDDRVSPTTTD